jgi:hypothetical protein
LAELAVLGGWNVVPGEQGECDVSDLHEWFLLCWVV